MGLLVGYRGRFLRALLKSLGHFDPQLLPRPSLRLLIVRKGPIIRHLLRPRQRLPRSSSPGCLLLPPRHPFIVTRAKHLTVPRPLVIAHPSLTNMKPSQGMNACLSQQRPFLVPLPIHRRSLPPKSTPPLLLHCLSPVQRLRFHQYRQFYLLRTKIIPHRYQVRSIALLPLAVRPMSLPLRLAPPPGTGRHYLRRLLQLILLRCPRPFFHRH